MPTYYEGKDCTITIGTAVASWSRYSYSEEVNTGSKYIPGQGRNYNYTLGKTVTLSLEGYSSVDESFVDLAAVESPVTTITGTGLPTDLVATHGEWRVTKKSMEQGDDMQTWTMELQGYFGTSTGGSGSG